MNIKEITYLLENYPNSCWNEIHDEWDDKEYRAIPSEILDEIYQECVLEQVKINLAGHENASLATLEQLAKDNSYLVRAAVAEHFKTNSEMLRKLSYDPSLWVLKNVVGNTHTDIDVLLRLASLNIQEINEIIAFKGNCPKDLLTIFSMSPHPKVRRAAGANWQCPEDSLCSLAADSELGIRSAVALNPSTPTTILTILSYDKNSHVRSFVASNVSTDFETLRRLSYDTEDKVKYEVFHNPQTPLDICERFANLYAY